MISIGDRLDCTLTSVTEHRSVEATIATLTEDVTRQLRLRALDVHGWRYSERGADEVVGVPTSVELSVSAVPSGEHYLVTVAGTAVVDGLVVDTRAVYDD